MLAQHVGGSGFKSQYCINSYSTYVGRRLKVILHCIWHSSPAYVHDPVSSSERWGEGSVHSLFFSSRCLVFMCYDVLLRLSKELKIRVHTDLQDSFN